MPPVNVLMKPASSLCNMRCSYCFYRDVSGHRRRALACMLTSERLEQILSSALEYAEGSCTFAFQGGEPTLAGLEFYQKFVELEKRYARPEVQVRHIIQTNGYCMDKEWAGFFAQNHFLVGLSLDGPPKLHNRNRRDEGGSGTHHRVLHSVQLLEDRRVPYNILCVLTGQNARSIQQIYQFFRRRRFQWLQFIPCLEPLGQLRGREPYHLSNEVYGQCLVTLFDLWHQDLKRGHYVSVRHFDNWMSILMGQEAEACGMQGRCAAQFVIEGDGGVYPCDFYACDQWRVGTVGEQSFQEMLDSPTWQKFLRMSHKIPDMCVRCRYYYLCRNGCRRDRLATAGGELGRMYYCQAYQYFFSRREKELYEAAQLLTE